MGRDKSQILPLGALPGKRICQVHSENSTREATIHVLDSRLSSQRRETSGWTKKQGRFMQADGAVHHVRALGTWCGAFCRVSPGGQTTIVL